MEILQDSTVVDKAEECRKVDDRLAKFKDTMSFINGFRELPQRPPVTLADGTKLSH